MRGLRVVGLDEDGETVICEDPDNGERFSVPADERLRAAARGDLTRLGQVQIELEAQMRPREIQARIRGGASVEDISAEAGIPEQRVERYAYPVLLERAQTAEKAQRAHPVREDGPDVQTLGEVVAHTFGTRGHDYAETTWDSWRGDDHKWVVQLRWHAGRSENSAHWVFHPGAHGGTVAPLDDHATDLLDPSPNRPLRTVRPVTELAREALELEGESQTSTAQQPVEPAHAPLAAGENVSAAHDVADTAPDAKPTTETPTASTPTAATTAAASTSVTPPVAEAPPARSKATIPPVPAASRLDGLTQGGTTENQQARMADQLALSSSDGEEIDSGEQADTADQADNQAAQQGQSGQRRGRKNHPIVPSWEDVLLGVRSNR